MTEPLRLPERVPVDAVIQCAMDMEAAPVLAALDPADADAPQRIEVGHEGGAVRSFTLGTLAGRRVLVAVSGIGLANSAAATARALALVDAPIVIAAGTTGGLARDIEVGQVAAGTSTIYGAADATAFGYAMGQIPQMPVDYRSSDETAARVRALADSFDAPVRIGRVVSVDSFVTAPIADPVRAKFPDAIGADMETCAMAQIAWSCGVDWVSLGAVSDLCGPSADQDFHMDSEAAAEISARAVAAYLALA